ncbi:MAG: tRNA (adenosine(37)-N6)-threonylcarbamoyltransferase complex ATPase subunit type 1 TsaE [Candidatus Bipolaricaulia bacterium]
MDREFISRSPQETIELGERMAQELRPGDCLALVGELGAGKTTLIKGLARGLGIPEDEVISPTFMLIREHRGGRLPLFHVDAYRIAKPEELQEIGLEEYLLSDEGITVIEWADRVREIIPAGCIEIRIQILSLDERRISILSPRATAAG